MKLGLTSRRPMVRTNGPDCCSQASASSDSPAGFSISCAIRKRLREDYGCCSKARPGRNKEQTFVSSDQCGDYMMMRVNMKSKRCKHFVWLKN